MMLAKSPLSLATALTAIGLVLVVIVTGASVPIYVLIFGDRPSRLLALPAVILLSLLLAISRKFLLLSIILLRASGDIFLNETKISLGGYAVGIGGLINGFVLLIAMLLVLEKPRVLPKKWVISAWAPFLLIALYGVASAPVKIDAIKLYLSQLSYFAIFISAFFLVHGVKDFRSLSVIVLWSSALPILYAFVDIGLNIPAGMEAFRLRSTFAHPNQFAFYLMLVLLLALYVLKSSVVALGPAQRLWLMAYMLLVVGLLLLTKTRSAWIACYTVFLIYALLWERRYLIYLLVIPVLTLLVPSVQERLLDLGAGNERTFWTRLNSFAWRRLIWESGLKWMEPSRYLLGYGLDSFRYYSPTFFPLAGHINAGAHSQFVQWFFELGAAGTMAYLWLIAKVALLSRTMRTIDSLGAFIIFLLILAYLTISLADNMPAYLAFNWYFWLVLGAASALVMASSSSVADGPAETNQRASDRQRALGFSRV
jgi:putative inorganic carbon (hco3(-)) transporter